MQDIEQIKQEVSPVLAREKRIYITNANYYESAADFLKKIKAAQSRVIAFFEN